MIIYIYIETNRDIYLLLVCGFIKRTWIQSECLINQDFFQALDFHGNAFATKLIVTNRKVPTERIARWMKITSMAEYDRLVDALEPWNFMTFHSVGNFMEFHHPNWRSHIFQRARVETTQDRSVWDREIPDIQRFFFKVMSCIAVWLFFEHKDEDLYWFIMVI